MTMRLDIVTNDAGELVRREHARELGAGVVVSIYRLAKLAQMHDLGNQAFLRQLDQTHQMIGEYGLRSGSNVSVLFADKATFVAGQLLKGNRGAYEAASELGDLFQRMGGSELHISRDITRDECRELAEAISTFHRTGSAAQIRLPAKIHLRQVADAARLRGIELESLSQDQRVVRAYASAVVIMRRFFEDLSASRYVLPRRIKRIAQSLVDLSDASTASYLGVTEVRNANFDEAGRAVNSAIVAVAIARECTQDRATLAQIAMAAMMHDVARPRALALAGATGGPMPGMAGPTSLSEDQEDRLAAGAAAVLTALGRVNEPTITRTVLTFEALWLRRRTWLGPVYWGIRPPTMHASIIAVARRYNDLLTPEPGLEPPTTDFAVATLAQELTEPQDRTVLRMLVSALDLLPKGTTVQLSTGEVAEVVRGTKGIGDRPRVRLQDGTEIEIGQDPRRSIQRVLSVEGWLRELEARAQPTYDADDPLSVPNLAASQDSGHHPSSASIPSMGSSPSAVAEAMGRVISQSQAPPAREPERPDRTVFQPRGPDDAPPVRSVPPVREATARGTLAATPIPHVLVYMLDHGLTGSVVFEGTNATQGAPDDTMYFVRGVPAKVRITDRVSPLGEVLVELGSLTASSLSSAIAGAKRMGVLFGEYCVGHDLVTRQALAWGLETQLLRKIAHVANLAPEIEYAYYRDIDLLEAWGGEVTVTHPLNAILASVRAWNDRGRVRATLARIEKHPLALHPDSEIGNLAVDAEERRVLDAIRGEAMPLAKLFELDLAPTEVVSSLVYTLAVTRQLAFKGQKKGPMAAVSAAWKSVAPASASMPYANPSRSAPSAPAPTSSRSEHPRPMARAQGTPSQGSAPQIRPITARKPTMVGLSPEPRTESGSRFQKPIPRSEPPEADVDDDAKTIALVSPAALRPPKPIDGTHIISEEGLADAEAGLGAMHSFRAAEVALSRNDLAGAERHAAKALNADPENADYRSLLAWIRSHASTPTAADEAIRTLSKILIDDPSNERALYYRAKLLLRTNRLHESMHDFEELLATNPTHKDASAEAQRLRQLLG
jgi:tetratricopeptide (TPR) repeat protein